MSGLPAAWRAATLGGVTEEKVSQSGPACGSSFAYVDISSVDNEAKRIAAPKTLPTADAPSRAKQQLRAGDVLVSMTRPNLNAVALVPPELDGAVGSTGFQVLRARGVEPGWLFYAVQTNDFVGAMSVLVQGALYPAVRPRDICSYSLPLPPTEEQRHLVAEIEKQFTRLDAGAAALRQVQAKLKRYRAAVLQAACEGRLVPTEAAWTPTPLSGLITGLGQGWSPKCDLTREPLPDEWAVITTSAVQPMQYVNHQGKPLPEALKPRPHLEVKQATS